MVVDDDACFLRYIEEVIDDAYDLFFAETGEEALAGFYQFAPDILLLDVNLPGMDGLEVCRRVRTLETITAPIIIMTSALATDHDVKNGYRAGADHYLTKPFDHHQLFFLLNRIPVKKKDSSSGKMIQVNY